MRRPLLVVAVALLCGIAYLAGMWSGMQSDIVCTVSGPGQIVCGDADSNPPAQPPQRSSSV